MSIIKRVSPLLNLDKYKTFIEDTDPNSLYLKINEFKDVFTGGKNGFVIEGTPYLRETTEVKIEIKDVSGNTVYVEPGDGTPEYYEGLSKVISTYVYDDTPIGEGLVTILAELKEYIDDDGAVRPVPDEWKGVYNLKWQRRITINRNFPNEDKVRFYLRPQVEIDEIVKPVYNITLPTVTRTGQVSGISELPLAGTNITNYGGGTIYRLQLSSGSWERAVDQNIVSVPSLNYEARVLEVLNDRVVLVDRPYTVNGVVSNFTSQSFTTTFEDIEQQEFVESNIFSSYAKLKINRLSTFVGDVERVKIYRKSRNSLEDFQFVQDITLEATEFLVDYLAENTNELYYGNFYGNNLYSYWVSGSIDHPIQPNTNILANSVRIDYQSSVGGIQTLITSQSFDFNEGVEYTLSHNLLYRGGRSNTAYVKAYLSSSTFLQEINTTRYSTDLLQRAVISTNFISDKTDTAKLVFEFVGDTTDTVTPSPEWYISNISLKSAEQTAFSPDEITFIQPIPRKISEEIFDFRFDFYDINNNYIPVTVTATKLFDGGNDIPGVGLRSFTLESDLQSFKFDTEGNPNPPNQQILLSVNKIGAFTGSVTFVSSAFDGNGDELTSESYAGGQYPGLLTEVSESSAILTLANFTGSRNDVTVTSVRYVASLEDVTSVLGIVRVIEGFPPSVLTAVASKNQFVFNPDDNLKPVTDGDFIDIFVNNRNFTSGSLTITSASNLPSLEVLSSTPSASIFRLYAGELSEYPASWSYYTPTSSSNQGTYTFSQQDLSANVQIQGVIEGAGAKGLFATTNQNQFFYKMTDLTPVPPLQNSTIQVKRQNMGRLDNVITVTSGSGKPPLTVVSDNLGIKTFGISASNYPFTAGETTYDFRALDLNNELYSDTVTITPIIAESQIAVNVTNENISLTSLSTGFIPSASFDFARGVILVSVGTDVINYNSPIQNNRFSASLASTTNVSGAFIDNSGVYGISRLDSDSGSVVLDVIYRDGRGTNTTFQKEITYSKTKKAAPIIEVITGPKDQSVTANSNGSQIDSFENVVVIAKEVYDNNITTKPFQTLTATSSDISSIVTNPSTGIITLQGRTLGNDVNSTSVSIVGTIIDSENVTREINDTLSLSKVKKSAPNVEVSVTPSAQSIFANSLGCGFALPIPVTVSATEGGVSRFTSIGTPSFTNGLGGTVVSNTVVFNTFASCITATSASVSIPVSYTDSEGVAGTKSVVATVSKVLKATPTTIVQLSSYAQSILNDGGTYGTPSSFTITATEGAGTYTPDPTLSSNSTFRVTPTNAEWDGFTITPHTVSSDDGLTVSLFVEYINSEGTLGDQTLEHIVSVVSDGVDGDDGVDSYSAILSNETFTLNADRDGVVISYDGSGTDVSVFKGETQLTGITSGTPTDGQFTVSTVVNPTSGITVGTITGGSPLVVGNHSNMNSALDKVLIEYTICAENKATLTKIQDISKINEPENAYEIGLTNNAVSIPADFKGDAKTYVGTGTDIYAFYGACKLTPTTSTPTDGQFRVFSTSVVEGSITVGGITTNPTEKTVVIGNHSAMPAACCNATILYCINAENRHCVPLYQTISKVNDGAPFTVDVVPSSYVFNADSNGCVSVGDLSNGKFTFDVKSGDILYTYDCEIPYSLNTYRVCYTTTDITLTPSVVSSQLVLTPTTPYNASGGCSELLIIDNNTSICYPKIWNYSIVNDGSTGVSILIDPSNQVVSGSVTGNPGPSFENPKPFTVIVEQNGTKFCYDNSLTNPSTFKITNVFSGSGITNGGNATSATITPIKPCSFNPYQTTFCVCYKDINSVISTPTQQRHGITTSINGSTGPGIVFTGLWECGRIYQYDLENGRRDAVLWEGCTPSTYNTYYVTKVSHCACDENKPVIAGNCFWEPLGTQDFFVAAKIGIFEESYIQNTLNIGTNTTGGISSANITLAGGTNYPYISIGQNCTLEGQIYGCNGIWIGRYTDETYRASLVGDSGALLWDGCDLTVNGSIIATSGRFDGDVCIGGRVIIGPNPTTPCACLIFGTSQSDTVSYEIPTWTSGDTKDCFDADRCYNFLNLDYCSTNSNSVCSAEIIKSTFNFSWSPNLGGPAFPGPGETEIDIQILNSSNQVLTEKRYFYTSTDLNRLGNFSETLYYSNGCRCDVLKTRLYVCSTLGRRVANTTCYTGNVTLQSCLVGIQPSISLKSTGLFTNVGQGEVSLVGLALETGTSTSSGGGGGGDGTVSEVGGCNGIGGVVTTTGCLFLTGQSSCLHNLCTNGLIVRCGTNGIVSRCLVAGSGICITNPDGVSGNITICATATALPAGVVSGSSQIDASQTTNWTTNVKTRLNAETVISGSSQVQIDSTSGTLGVSRGGTGVNTTPLVGQLLIGNGTNFTLRGLCSGTGISITTSAGCIGISGCTGTVTSVSATGNVSGITLSSNGGTTPTLTLGGTLSVAPSNFNSQNANTFLAAPNGFFGAPTFRTIVAADVPTLNQNTTGNAGSAACWTTSRTLTIGNCGKPVNGASDVSFSLSEIGAYSSLNPSGYTSCTGTVTSVTLSMPGIFSVTNPTISTSGTISVALQNQTQNCVFASPNGGTGTPTFRSLVEADIPNISVTKLTGTLPVANGGTGQAAFTTNTLLCAAGTNTLGFVNPANLVVGNATLATAASTAFNACCLSNQLPSTVCSANTIVQRTAGGDICGRHLATVGELMFRGSSVDSAITRNVGGLLVDFGTNDFSRFGTTVNSGCCSYSIRLDARSESFYNGIFFYRRTWSGGSEVELAKMNCDGITSKDFILSSDRRIKCNIQPLLNNLEKINCITPYSYNKQGKDEIGIIAQDLQTIYPQSVFSGSDGYLNISAQALPTILLGAVKELTEKVNCLECLLKMKGDS